MVDEQLRSRGIRDRRVLDAFLRVPRERFVPEDMRVCAYDDGPLPIGHGQTISQPYIVALMTEALQLSGREKVLEIGTGSGYQSAILAEIGCDVRSVEKLASLAERAGEVLAELGYRVLIRVGDGTLGWAEEQPFDRIVVTAGSPGVPPTLVSQLKMGGRLVIPVGDRAFQELLLVVRRETGVEKQSLGGCQFVPLLGREGWKE